MPKVSVFPHFQIDIFKPSMQNIQTFVLSKTTAAIPTNGTIPEVLFVDGPKIRPPPTNPRWRTAQSGKK